MSGLSRLVVTVTVRLWSQLGPDNSALTGHRTCLTAAPDRLLAKLRQHYDEGSEDSESDANPDLPQDEAEEPANSPAAIPDEVPSVDDSSADKGKERAASPTPDTDREVAKTMKLIDSAMQKDLAGRQVLQQQNLELQEPPVSTPLFLSPLPMLISFLGSSAIDALK